MQNTRLIFLRHADTQKDPSINAAEWGLSEKGKQQAEEASKLRIMDAVDVIYVSEEPKTSLTVEPLAKRLSEEVQALSAFNEVKRGDKFLTKEEFEQEKVKQLTDLSYQAFGGETGEQALERFKKGIDQVVVENTGKTVLIVTHGTVLNIYFAHLLNANAELPDRWSKTAFCAVGVIENSEVVQDIISPVKE